MFPSLFSQCSIDWFLPWPKEALIDVSGRFIGDFKVEATKEVKESLIEHMGECHAMVATVCEIYFERMRRRVFVTPKSYLSFIALYKDLYTTNWAGIDKEQRNITSGLDKLLEATAGVGEMKKQLQAEDIKLRAASDETAKIIATLTVENEAADKKTVEVEATKNACIQKKASIAVEKEDADRDLKAAMPFVHAAEKALSGIKDSEITELKGSRKPHGITRIIFDTLHLLFMLPLVPVVQKEGLAPGGKKFDFIADSYDEFCGPITMQGPLKNNLTDFGMNQKNFINEETIELMEPYLNIRLRDAPDVELFRPEIAKGASSALMGICSWARAMSDYHKASKIVKPKLKLLQVKAGELQVAESQLAAAEAELAEVIEKKMKLDAMYAEKQAVKEEMQATANKLKRKMDQATKLIESLADNKIRWTESSKEFQSQKIRLIGDVAKAAAFVSYVGPFNAEYRDVLSTNYFEADLNARAIPNTDELKLTNFLVDEQTIGDWNMEGLPTDDLSIQNGIMVTRSSRYPLMIDPQSQAITWIKQREPELEQMNCIFTLANPNLRDQLKIPLMDGLPVLIENIENEVDPMLDPLLEKQVTVKGRSMLLKLGDQEFDYHPKFRLYMTSRMSNPLWSPELAAKTTIIDFAVTQSGLEQQLLGRLISREQKSLEDQLNQVKESVNLSKKTLAKLEADLLQRLATAEGSLLDDSELIDVLGNIKTKSAEVKQSLEEASQKQHEIGEKREAFRPVAARGAVLYFCVVEMAGINWMYNVSLGQFLELFYHGIDHSPKAQLVKDRVVNIINALTYKVYRYINRGIFERDKVTFRVMMAMRILMKDGALTSADVGQLLKAGAAIDDRNKKFSWLEQKAWNNIVALTKHRFGGEGSSAQFFYKGLIDSGMSRQPQEWRAFYESDAPEKEVIPDYEDKINADQVLGHFLALCLVRSFREDRTVAAMLKFISDVLGPEYVAPVSDDVSEIWEETLTNKPTLYLLSTGADPTSTIDDLARKPQFKKFPCKKVSMGEEMEGPAYDRIKDGFKTGDWVILNNCHLSLEFMAEMETILNPKDVEVHEDFRLWITCAPDKSFPLGLLQMAIKVTMEPPSGMKAGLHKTYNTMVNADFLEKVEPYEKWRPLTYAACFLHSVVQERRKFGPIGFSMPYEFNSSDLDASMLYMEKQFTSCAVTNRKYEWEAMQYMTGAIQYGGKITQELDRELFGTYTYLWIREEIFNPSFQFNQQTLDFNYVIPDFPDHQSYLQYIASMP
jgi:dynein heavy chain